MRGEPELPQGVLLAFYGDDFTGSSAVMEVMTFAGLPAVMFVEAPAPERLRRFADRKVVGVASVARSQPVAWMDAHLPAAFSALEALGAPINHYKVCSTLDSSPTIGSIGRALDLGAPIFGRREGAADWTPLVVAAPAIGRYQSFGNLFAAYRGDVYRLDRHPVMRRHPVTPMREADVRLHVGEQTRRGIGLVDGVAMKTGRGDAQLAGEIRAGRSVVALDVIDDETLRWVGEQIWRRRGAGIFAVGSQGLEYALVAYLQAAGLLPKSAAPQAGAERAQIVAVSGSVSPLTATQIDWALAHGFDLVEIDAAAAVDERRWRAELAAAGESAAVILSRGRSPLAVTARGPQDPQVRRFLQALEACGEDAGAVHARLGSGLGEWLGGFVRNGLKRAAASGGDTAGFAMRALGVDALEALAPIAPGAPLCRAYSDDARIDGVEISLKGGQMGDANYFGSVRAGRALETRET